MRAIDKIMKRKIFNVCSDKHAVGAVTGPRGGSQRALSGLLDLNVEAAYKYFGDVLYSLLSSCWILAGRDGRQDI